MSPVALGLLALATACTPKPGAVCERAVALRAADRPMDSDRQFRLQQACIRVMAPVRESNPEGYRETSRCILGLQGPGQQRALAACMQPVMPTLRAMARSGELGELLGAPPQPEQPALRFPVAAQAPASYPRGFPWIEGGAPDPETANGPTSIVLYATPPAGLFERFAEALPRNGWQMNPGTTREGGTYRFSASRDGRTVRLIAAPEPSGTMLGVREI